MKMNNLHEKAVQALLYGQSCAKRLKLQLDDPTAVPSYDLAKSIVDCISKAVSNLSDQPKSDDEQFSDLSSRDSSPSHPQMSLPKKRKIRSSNSSENWRDDSPDPLYYDGFIWRKYGQKYIKNSDHQRSYYKCSYNIDHHCGARKHEQKIKDNPPVYRTTYFGHHTCKINHTQDVVFNTVVDPLDDLETAKMIRFGKDLDQKKENHSSGSSSFMKKETKDHDDCQHVMKEENLSSSGCGSKSSVYDSELLWDNPGFWDPYDQFDIGFYTRFSS